VSMPRVVAVECDRCHRPGWTIGVSELTGRIVLDGHRLPDGESQYWQGVLSQPSAHRYRQSQHYGRAGAFIIPATRLPDYGTREKLVCIGRKHPRYERVVTEPAIAAAYKAAVAADRSRIGMREIQHG